MPSWSARLLASSSAISQSTPAPQSQGRRPDSLGPADDRQGGTQATVDLPTLHPSPRLSTASRQYAGGQAPRHGRSKSHPFPTFFGGGGYKRAERTVDRVIPEAGAESAEEDEDDDFIPAPPNNQRASPLKSDRKVKGRASSEMVEGQCMTCNSTVHWPRRATSFRCTVCKTIHDRKPQRSYAQGSKGIFGRAIGKSSNEVSPTQPLSIRKTEDIIDNCINSYLENVRRNHEQSPSLLVTPPRSPADPCRNNAGEEDYLDGLARPLPLPRLTTRTTPTVSSSFRVVRYRGDESERSKSGTPQRPTSEIYSSSSPGQTSSPSLLIDDRSLHNGLPVAPARRPPPPPPQYRRSNERHTASLQEPVSDPSSRNADSGSRRVSKADASSMASEEARDGDFDMFRPLEDYIIKSFTSHECINSSFLVVRPRGPARAASEDPSAWLGRQSGEEHRFSQNANGLSQVDEKTLLIGDIAENGSWWTGARNLERRTSESAGRPEISSDGQGSDGDLVSVKTPRIDWFMMREWYNVVMHAGRGWKMKWQKMHDANRREFRDKNLSSAERLTEIDCWVEKSRDRVWRKLLKATESLLKRPCRPIMKPVDLRYLLIILGNPSLYSSCPSQAGTQAEGHISGRQPQHEAPQQPPGLGPGSSVPNAGIAGGQHSRIIKRVLGLMANLPNECHHYLVSWFSRFSEKHFRRMVDLVGGFTTYRLARERRSPQTTGDPTGGLVPVLDRVSGGSSAHLHAAIGLASTKRRESSSQPLIYGDDWQLKAAAKVMALLFSANCTALTRRREAGAQVLDEKSRAPQASAGLAAKQRAHNHGQLLPTSDFYSSLLDYADLIADFEAWESRRGKFSFCQYPFFLSIWAKIHILEFDARRQMEDRAREAFFDSIMSRKIVSQFLVLRVRRDCLAEDSLRGVSEVVGTGQEEIKKGLRIEFVGEEGVDAGGLRKEWFLLLVRDVFDPNHGLFVYDEDSNFCYFNPHCFETSDQFFLVGVLLGLAIYNSTILDIPLPPFAFKKLLAAAPSATTPVISASRLSTRSTLEDLAEFRPVLAQGLQQLLDYDGDVEETFCRDFVAEVDRYGQVERIPLCPGGDKRAVTNANRRDFVDLYVQYLLDISVSRQFEPFKRGFFTVCGGNALSLFRPEEIELLVRGSDEPLDIPSLRAVAKSENWGSHEEVLDWFWDFFGRIKPEDQRKLVSFITGSDRIPAAGTTNLVIKISCMGDDCERFPVARTCFNTLCLWRYDSRQKLESKLWRAVQDSEGFGLR
ncbi:MAG: hypothetical protein M1825_002881 [Sarcosagium campestre]|nr:MAG: hypothetical protein M1825_002881 [Sarcosagium campestre]